MGGRGGGGAGGKGANGGNGDLADPRVLDGVTDKQTAGEAASELGLPDRDKPSFVDGADGTDRLLPPPTKPPSAPGLPGKGKGGASDLDELAERHKKAVAAYQRKYGRGAAKRYSQGAYWSLLRYAKAVLATVSTVQQGASAPAHAAVNSAAIAAYWYGRFTR